MAKLGYIILRVDNREPNVADKLLLKHHLVGAAFAGLILTVVLVLKTDDFFSNSATTIAVLALGASMTAFLLISVTVIVPLGSWVGKQLTQ